ncbi:hypothetical protein ACFQ3L_09845 [Lacticaseibacillus jixianensis]|uniref:Cyclic lactone autoinducer peptide n=1 Tax=Lacticaseibacillus jixianensis TaxID=2486012 RepID=A0ABW4BAW5_9LACO|nr:hypothetical protein [Lacticaseibacillus jixianensis]
MKNILHALAKGIASFFTVLASNLNRPFLPLDSERKRRPRKGEDDWRDR